MKQYISRRAGYSLLSLFLLSLTIFFFVRVTGDPAALLVEPGASPADIAAIHHQFGLDRPLFEQYLLYLANVARLDFGLSFQSSRSVAEVMQGRLANTLVLILPSMIVAYALGAFVGALLAWYRGGKAEIGAIEFNWTTMDVGVTGFVLRGLEDAGELPLFRAASVRARLKIQPRG